MKRISLVMIVAFAAVGWVQAAMQDLTGTNTVGFVSVVSPANANTIITVPFEACFPSGATGNLADLVATNGLTANANAALADQLVVLTTYGPDLVYYYYYHQPGAGWTGIETQQIMPDGTTKRTLTPPAATDFQIARGLGFWLKRVAGATSSVYLQGQVSSAKQATAISPGLNLIGCAALSSFTLNASGIDWTGAHGSNGISSVTDKILVNNGDGTLSTYFYYVKAGGNAELMNKWVESTPTGPVLPNKTILAGQGFWYYRRGPGSFTLYPNGQ